MTEVSGAFTKEQYYKVISAKFPELQELCDHRLMLLSKAPAQ